MVLYFCLCVCTYSKVVIHFSTETIMMIMMRLSACVVVAFFGATNVQIKACVFKNFIPFSAPQILSKIRTV